MDNNIYNKLRDANIDHLLAQHVAHLFIRDTVSLFSEKVNQAPTDSDHFEVSNLSKHLLCKQCELEVFFFSELELT